MTPVVPEPNPPERARIISEVCTALQTWADAITENHLREDDSDDFRDTELQKIARLWKALPRLVKAEIRAQAAGRFANPKNAVKLIDVELTELVDHGWTITRHSARHEHPVRRARAHAAQDGRRARQPRHVRQHRQALLEDREGGSGMSERRVDLMCGYCGTSLRAGDDCRCGARWGEHPPVVAVPAPGGVWDRPVPAPEPDDWTAAILTLRRAMCTPAGREQVERELLRPFGVPVDDEPRNPQAIIETLRAYVHRETPDGGDVAMPDAEEAIREAFAAGRAAERAAMEPLREALRNAPCNCDHPLRAGLGPCDRCAALARSSVPSDPKETNDE